MTQVKLTPLRLCLLSAVLVHLLGLSAWQLQRSRQRPPQRLSAADDTPLLLQFSRQEPAESTLLAVPLPPASILPPPPPGAGGARSGSAGPGAPPPKPASRTQSRTATTTRPAADRPPQPAAARIAPPSLASGSPAREALEAALREAGAASGNGREVLGGADGEAPQGHQRPDGGAPASGPGAQAAELRLWTLGRPMPLPDRGSGGLHDLKLRRLDLAVARRSGAKPLHRASLRSEDRLILFWIDGPSLWLLSAPIPPAGDAAPPGAEAG